MNARLPINLMLVEDERIVAFDLKRQLHAFGYAVGSVVASGEQAVEQVMEAKPDLVLMDIHLEGQMDGIEAASVIRSQHQIPVVFLTAYAEEDTLRRALDSRPFGYLVKPCEGRELHATIQMALARHEDELAIQRSEERLQLALDAGSLGVLEWSPATNRLQGDVHLGMLLGDRLVPLDEPWDNFIARVIPTDRERVKAALNPALSGAKAVQVQFRTVGDHQPPRYMEAHVKAYGGTRAGGRVVGILQDVTQRHRTEERLRQSSVVFHTSAEAILITDAKRSIVAVNPAFTRITGFTEDEVLSLDPDVLLRVSHDFERGAASADNGTEDYRHGEVRCYRKTGDAFPAWQSVSVVRDAAGQATHFVTAFSDVTAIYDAQQQLQHLAHHDPLTGLPNRLLFADRLENAIEQGLRNEQRYLLLFLDLDGFKLINDTLGHAVGDELLRVVGLRLKSVLRASDTVARLGGDEFVILAGTTDNPDYATQLAQKILEQLRLPVLLSGHTLSITASLGVAAFPDNGSESQQLMRAADMAMYSAKASGRNRYHLYTDDLSTRADERMYIEQGLRRAIASDSLAVYYQPRVDLRQRRIVGAEALVRWPHGERGLIVPDDFIAIAEDSGIIEQLGRWVLLRACSEMLALARHIKANGEIFHLAVNVSARQFIGADFVAVVRSILDETGFPADALELEITESTLQGTERSVLILKSLAAMGVAVSIDDFGTGYSSLSVLRDLPVNRIKIDRSFIVGLPESESQRAIVTAIVALCRVMCMAITVEGIERKEQADLLQQLGCHEGQGYYFGRPVSYADFSLLLDPGPPAPGSPLSRASER
jgi:diguanylate cyclase (GGDEF)-like protein/PAS domain S-box-containing protein